jgi:hypothetical protein
MAENEQVGSAFGYNELLASLNNDVASRVIGADKLDKATDVLSKITTTHLALSQFGFYKKLTDSIKGQVQSKLEAVANTTGESGTELGTIKVGGAPINDGYDPEQGVFGRVIGKEAPEPQVDTEVNTFADIGFQNAPNLPPPNIDLEPIPIEGFPFPAPRGGAGFQSIAANDTIGGLIPNYAENPPQALARLPYNPEQPLFADEAGLPSIDFESRAPLFLGQASGNVGVVRRGGVPEPPQQPPPQPEGARPRPVEGEAEVVSNEPVARPPQLQPQADIQPEIAQPTEAASLPEQLPQTFAQFSEETQGVARQAAGALGQEIAKTRTSFVSKIGQYINKAQDVKTSVDNGIQRINRLRTQATDAFDNIKADGQATIEKGQGLIQQGRDALARGDQTGQTLLDQGNDFITQGLEQAKNSDLARIAVNQAQDYIQRGSDLVAQGKAEGQQLIQQGQDLLKSAQTQISGYGQQAEQIGQAIQTEVEARTAQLADLASTASKGFSAGKQAVSAIASGDTEGAVTASQQVGKAIGSFVGQVAGEETGEAVGGAIASAIPVVGEIVDAGLLLSTLATGIADAFQPHHLPTFISSATQQYGV